MISVLSKGIINTKGIECFFEDILVFGITNKTTKIAGWGNKKTAQKAQKKAIELNIPYLALEDGFYRSLDLGCNGSRPYSLIIDEKGIYYNSFKESQLEIYLNDDSWITHENIERAKKAITYIIDNNLSKYNQAKDISTDYFSSYAQKEKILIIDQTYNDASVLLSGADETSFKKMVEDALQFENAQIFIKIHPDVLCGKKKGYLTEYIYNEKIKIITEDVSSLSLLKQMDKVFVVSSQMGFEALLLGKNVYCYGLPFYAGWGLTHDKIACERRKKTHSIESLFYAACIKYPSYVNPITDKKCELEDILELLVKQKECNELNRGTFICVGFSYWKYPHARAYLQGTDNQIYFYKNYKKALLAAKKYNAKIVAWSSKITHDFVVECENNGISLIQMEDGFLRSVGLGSDFNWPFSLVLDSKGIYYNPQKQSDLEYLLQNFNKRSDKELLWKQAEKIQKFIIDKGLSKYNVGDFVSLKREDYTNNKKIILVPGQVEDDASVRLGGGIYKSNLALLKSVRENNPDACILYKPHPDVEKLNRKGKISEEIALQYADYVVTNTNITKLFDIIDEVHTLTSQTGFEALLRGIKVYCYGLPFYAGWGLTCDMQAIPRRTEKITINTLIASTLLLYPRYYDWRNSCFCNALDVCFYFTEEKLQYKSPKWARYCVIFRKSFCKLFNIGK